MSEVIHQMFGLFGDKYYAVDDCDRIVIPNDLDYKSSAIVTKIHDCTDEAELDVYQYYTDLMTDCNSERVKYMKDFLLGEKIVNIEKINNNFVVGITYTLYDKNGKVVKSGNSEVDAQWCMPIILSDVKEGNMLEYHKGIIMDGRIEICIPDTIRYGIRNSANRHPYTLRISKVYAVASNGGYKYITEDGSQLDTGDCSCGANSSHHYHASNAQYRMHHHNGLCDTNFNSCFVTNAKLGTTIIDQVVTSAKLEAPPEYEKIDICHIPLGTSDYTIKLNHKLKHIIVNLEIFVDNFNEVYDREDIAKLLSYNALQAAEDIESGSTDSDDEDNDLSCGCSCCKPQTPTTPDETDGEDESDLDNTSGETEEDKDKEGADLTDGGDVSENSDGSINVEI